MNRRRLHISAGGRFHRRGSGYVLILGAAMLVSVIGLTSLTLVRVQWRTEQTAIKAGRSRLYARSAVETAVAYTLADPTWRTNYATLQSYMPMSIDRGYCSVALSELDGTTLVAAADSEVLLTATGRVGSVASPDAVSKWSVQARHPPLDLLRTALHSANWVYVNGANLELAEGPISSATTLYNSGSLQGDVEANTISNWGWISGSITSNAPAKQMPASNAWSYYRYLPTLVTLPAFSVGGDIDWVLLSPDSNPWESTKKSVDGLYYIRPTADLRIEDCRIVGTLMVDLSWGRKLVIDDGVLWEPARPDFPSLIVNGPCEIRHNSTLYEMGIANFNPSSTPYQGSSDTDRTDSYSSLLKGVFHIIGSNSTVLLENQTRIKGVVIAEGTVTIEDYVRLTADPNLFLCPPLKYRMPQLELVSGTWQPLVSP